MGDTLICPRCKERLWVREMQIPLLTCPRCFGVIVNPNAAARTTVPKQVVPVEREVFYDLKDTVGGLSILAVMLIIGAAATIWLGQIAITVILVGCGLMLASYVGLAQRKRPEKDEWQDAILDQAIDRPGKVLEYSREKRVPAAVTIFGFMGGFILAIAIGVACFYAMIATGDRSKLSTRWLVFLGMMAAIFGLIVLAVWAGKNPRLYGLGRGVAVGLGLSMLALGPCGACYVMTLFG